MDKSENIQQVDQGNGQESLDELKEQFDLQKMRLVVGQLTKDFDMQKDAAIQAEKIMQKVYAHKKDALLPNDPFWSLYKELIDISHVIVKDLSNLPDDSKSFLPDNLEARFDDKIKERVNSGKITGLTVPKHEFNPYVDILVNSGKITELTVPKHNLYVKAVCRAVPDLPMLTMKSYWRLRNFFADGGFDLPHYNDFIQSMYKYIAEQRRDVNRKLWAHDLNSGIKNEEEWIANIGAGIQKFGTVSSAQLPPASNTQTFGDIKETVLNTIRNNLIGEDQDLKAKTIELLAKDPVLKQMVVVDPKMPLVKMMHNQGGTEGPLKKVPGHLFREMTKY